MAVWKGTKLCPLSLWEGAVGLKGLIWNNFHFSWVLWTCKDNFELCTEPIELKIVVHLWVSVDCHTGQFCFLDALADGQLS